MAVVNLVFGLVAGHAQFFGVDDDDIIAGVDVRREFGLVLAAQPACDFAGDAAENLARRVITNQSRWTSCAFAENVFMMTS